MELTYLYLLLTFLLFFIYFIVISLFGYLICIIFNKNYLYKKLTLKRLLKTFAIGLSLHLIYGTIIISLRIFNFLTIYIPFIICDIGLMIYIFYKKSNSIKNHFRMYNKRKVISFLKEKRSFIIIFCVVFFLLFELQLYFINHFQPYQANDPYFWFNNIWFVHKYGFLDYTVIKSYTPGFVIFCSSMISIINNYYWFYYIFKFLPLFLSVINILVLFVISKDIFKNKIYICFTLVMYLSFTYIFFRNNKSLPSLLATTLGFLFLLFLGKGSSKDIDLKNSNLRNFLLLSIKNKRIFLKGLLITGITLANPIYGLFFMIFYFLYEFFLFFTRLKTEFKPTHSKLLLTRNFFLTQLLTVLIFVILITPFIVGTSINIGRPIFEAYLFYFKEIEITQNSMIQIPLFGGYFREIGVWFLYESFYRYIHQFFSLIFTPKPLSDFYIYTIQIGIFLLIIGIFINFNKHYRFNEKQNTLIKFFKFTFILTIVIFGLFELIYLFEIPIFYDLIKGFFYFFRIRLFELFSGYWAIIFVLTFNYIIISFKKKYLKLKNNKTPSKKINELFNFSHIYLIFLTMGFFYFTNFGNIDFTRYFNHYQVEAISFIGNHFEENPLEDTKGILLEDLNSNSIYGLIVDVNLEKKYYKFTIDLNYSKFNNEFNILNCEFIALNISKLNEYFIANFSNNFDIIYEGTYGFIFATIK